MDWSIHDTNRRENSLLHYSTNIVLNLNLGFYVLLTNIYQLFLSTIKCFLKVSVHEPSCASISGKKKKHVGTSKFGGQLVGNTFLLKNFYVRKGKRRTTRDPLIHKAN